MHRLLMSLIVLTSQYPGAFASDIHGCHSVRFPATSRHERFRPRTRAKFAQDVFQQSLNLLPEALLVQTVIAGVGRGAGLSQKQQERLLPVFGKTYVAIANDERMFSLPSALPYCLASTAPADGHYFLFVPEQVNETTESIVFLHGFGGNFLFHLKVLKDEFPDAIVVLPSWGRHGTRATQIIFRKCSMIFRDAFPSRCRPHT